MKQKNNMIKIPDCFYRVSIKALVLDEEKRFLLTKESSGKWEMPGGGLEFEDQNHKHTINREMMEEMGLETTHIDEYPSYFLTFKRDDGNYCANVFYLTQIKHLNFTKSDECLEARFFTKEEALKENLFLNIVDFVGMYDRSKN